ncbi:acetylglutamate synthase [Sodiomyces alkalinus F11]|uniref:Amino-acid acetyltransferase, mitochondrial n=1 Tax=Sodiomyces alkalinus (strain CBS 110278 / VKM F-3762 / F11) TaxID=1314773 RepID=A0A3N2PJV7_SODAK|nr:acetylglutamate synthase [Sodiomyces alkalinus F11]ROT34818.1 acetylglutamate synthase [Sodiomyces alkalinus F11]
MIVGSHASARLRSVHRLSSSCQLVSCIRDHLSMRAPWSSKSNEKRRTEDRQDIVVSVLQASATRREAQGYLKKYAPQAPQKETRSAGKNSSSLPPFGPYPLRSILTTPTNDIIQQRAQPHPVRTLEEPPNVALVKLRQLDALDDEALTGIAKTLSYLRKLGLLSIIVLHQELAASRDTYRHQTHRIQIAIDRFGPPGARVLDQIFMGNPARCSNFMPSSLVVRFPHTLIRALDDDALVIIPPIALTHDMSTAGIVDPDNVIVALVKYLSGLQFEDADDGVSHPNVSMSLPPRIASVERIIILDPLGGIPLVHSESSHRFINLEQEFKHIMEELRHEGAEEGREAHLIDESRRVHIRNLQLSQNVLAILPETSATIITTPSTAALKAIERVPAVATRNRLNPLIHNLLTDKPVLSPSLPLERVRTDQAGKVPYEKTHLTTVVKRGMPLTIYPDPTNGPWVPPRPGEARMKLTDTCIDLGRLQFLIENSFGRKLELQHYLDRVNNTLAGVIIAGEYEGVAILTWEKPSCLEPEAAYQSGRLVPYLDKFAVLQNRQGSGGVADVVFNAMVRSCFPDGVCWRSRKDNPVNKWYFERSMGTYKLGGTNWQIFWTTPHVLLDSLTLRDYEDVCRHAEPSWVDNGTLTSSISQCPDRTGVIEKCF